MSVFKVLSVLAVAFTMVSATPTLPINGELTNGVLTNLKARNAVVQACGNGETVSCCNGASGATSFLGSNCESLDILLANGGACSDTNQQVACCQGNNQIVRLPS